MATFTKSAEDIFDPVDSGGNPRAGDMAEVRTWGMEVEGGLATFGQRVLLTEPRTYYVRTDGDDSNDGLSDDSGGAFLTLQGAYDHIASRVDMGGNVVTVQVGNGTYTAGAQDTGKPAVGGRVLFRGDPVTPSNVVIDVQDAGDDCFLAGFSEFVVSGFRMRGAGSCLHAARSGTILTGPGLEFGDCAEFHFFVDNGGHLVVNSDYKIIGDAQAHYYQHTNGYLAIGPVIVTLTGTPAFSVAFAVAVIEGMIEAPLITFSGAAAGLRFIVDRGGNIFTGYAGVNYFPGSIAGYVLSGFYDDTGGAPGEVSSFTPTYEGFTAPGATTQTQSGTCIVIGKLCFVNARVNWSAHSGGTGGACIAGLPYPPAEDSTLPVWSSGVAMSSGKQLGIFIGAGTTKARLIQSDVVGGAQAVVPTDAAGDVLINGTYRIA